MYLSSAILRRSRGCGHGTLGAGIRPWSAGCGDFGTLLETRGEPSGALDSEMIARIIEKAGLIDNTPA